MKQLHTSILLFTTLFGYTQNRHRGVILDREDKEPLEFVNVFNSDDSTISNADGQYAFSSSTDSVILYRAGYDKLKTTFSALRDTILLEKSIFHLNEVIVTNKKSAWERFKDSIRSNYRIEPYKEKFFLRCVLRRNDTIVRIQDMIGKLQRKTLFYPTTMELNKKDFQIELTNMRKVGVDTDNENIYFIFPSFFQALRDFVTINVGDAGFELEEFQLHKQNTTRLEFKKIGPKQIWKRRGHVIINNADNAILEFISKITSEGATFNKNRWLRFRTLRNDSDVFFGINQEKGDYFLKSAKNFVMVEAIDKDNTFKHMYTFEIILNTFDNFGDFEVKSNINEQKDMFKLKFPFNAKYWNSQNQLLLTKEMEDFIERMGSENKEFKIRTNLE